MPEDASLNRGGFLRSAGVALAATQFATTNADAATTTDVAQATTDVSIREFRVSFPEAKLADMRRRINATHWPDRETVDDTTQGVQLAMIQGLATYWATSYDWRRCEA